MDRENKYNDNSNKDISLLKRQTWLQNQVNWTRVIKKDKKWRKSKDRTFRTETDIKIEPDPYKFKYIPRVNLTFLTTILILLNVHFVQHLNLMIIYITISVIIVIFIITIIIIVHD